MKLLYKSVRIFAAEMMAIVLFCGTATAQKAAPSPTMTATDALTTLQHATGKQALAGAGQLFAMDSNGDGAVTAQDALITLQIAVGLVSPLPESETQIACTSVALPEAAYREFYNHAGGAMVMHQAKDMRQIAALSVLSLANDDFLTRYDDRFFEENDLILAADVFSHESQPTMMRVRQRGTCIYMERDGATPWDVPFRERWALSAVPIEKAAGVQQVFYEQDVPDCVSSENAVIPSFTVMQRLPDNAFATGDAFQMQTTAANAQQARTWAKQVAQVLPGVLEDATLLNNLMAPRLNNAYFDTFVTVYCAVDAQAHASLALRPVEMAKDNTGWHIQLGTGDTTERPFVSGGIVLIAIDLPRAVVGDDSVWVDPLVFVPIL